MAYLMYKKIRDHRRAHQTSDQQPNAPVFRSKPDETNDTTPRIDEDSAEKPIESEHEPRKSISDKVSKEVQTAAEKQEKKDMMIYRAKIFAGIFFPLLTFSLNNTMIAAALPFIASDFHEFSQLNWIISSGTLTATAFVPSWGQFADIFGRYITMQASIVILIIGSALSAGAPTTNFPMFLAGKGLQGVGIAGVMVLGRIILSDKVSLKDNAINNVAFTVIVGIGYGIGPVIGGALTSVSWRWIFILNVITSVAGLPLMHFVARPVLLGPQASNPDAQQELSHRTRYLSRLSAIDFGGQFLFLFGMGLLILALTWAGAYYPWDDVKVLAPLVIGVALLLAFIAWEYLLMPGNVLQRRFPNQKAMIPLQMLFTRNAGILVYINIVTGMSLYAVFYFVVLYFTIVHQFGSNKSGQNLLFYLPGLGVGAYLSIFICNVTPRKTWYPVSAGTLIEAIGITLIAAALHWNHLPVVYAMLAITGLGTGVRFMPNTLHAVGYHRNNIATVVSLMSMAASLGQTLASTIMLNIFNNRMSDVGISLVHGASSASSFNSIDHLPQREQQYIRSEANKSLVVAFYGISSFMWLGVIAVLFLGNVNIPKKSKMSDDSKQGEQVEGDGLTKGAYIGSLFRRHPERDESV